MYFMYLPSFISFIEYLLLKSVLAWFFMTDNKFLTVLNSSFYSIPPYHQYFFYQYTFNTSENLIASCLRTHNECTPHLLILTFTRSKIDCAVFEIQGIRINFLIKTQIHLNIAPSTTLMLSYSLNWILLDLE